MKKIVLITGTNRGIGREMCKAFAAADHYVIAHARTRTAEHEGLIESLRKGGAEIEPVYFDMRDADAMKQSIQRLYSEKKYIDVLVNNAGVAHGGFFAMTKVSAIREVFDINLFAHMEITQLVLRGMIKKKQGCIINMASIAGFDLNEGNSAYGVSKAAVIAWTKTLAKETARYGIRVNAIAPGLTDTDMAAQMEQKAAIEMVEQSAMKRLGKKEEIAQVAVFLASDNASFINGQTIRVDGGG